MGLTPLLTQELQERYEWQHRKLRSLVHTFAQKAGNRKAAIDYYWKRLEHGRAVQAKQRYDYFLAGAKHYGKCYHECMDNFIMKATVLIEKVQEHGIVFDRLYCGSWRNKYVRILVRQNTKGVALKAYCSGRTILEASYYKNIIVKNKMLDVKLEGK